MSEARQTEILEHWSEDDTGLLTVLQQANRCLRLGKAYEVSVSESMTKDSAYKISFDVPAEADATIFLQSLTVSSTAAVVSVELYEDITSSGGSEVTPINQNRNSSNASEVTVKEDVTADVSSATPIQVFYVGSGSGPNNVTGGLVMSSDLLELKYEKEYIIVITELDVDATQVDIDIRWSEED
jgi:hypothetical protein